MELRTTIEVIEELGGSGAVAKLCGLPLITVYNWRARNKFPAYTHPRLTAALHELGHTAPGSLWGVLEGAKT